MLEESYEHNKMLADLAIDLCERTMRLLGIGTTLRRPSEIGAAGVKDTRLIAMVQALGGTRYLSGPAARAYLQPDLWKAAVIKLVFKGYAGYPEYPQISEPFDPAVSVIDLIAMTGPKAGRYLERH